MGTSTGIEQLTTQYTKANLPEGWHMVRFGDMVRNVDVSERDPLAKGIERYIGLDHLDPESLHIKRWGQIEDGTSFSRKFVTGQVLFGKRRAYQRKAAIAEFDGICSGDILVFKAKDDLLPELLPFIVQSNGFFEHALDTSAGSLSPRTKWKDLAEYVFPLPPKDEQRRIADILWALDVAITKWEQTLHEFAVLRKTLIDVSISNYYKLPDQLNLGTKEYQMTKLHEVCAWITDGTHLPPQFVPNGIPFLLVSNLASGTIDWNISKWITKETYRELTKRVKPEAGDVLYTVVGSFGVPVLITWEQPFSFQRHIAILKPKKGLLDGAYLTYFLESSFGKKQAELSAVGNAQKTITLGSLRNFQLPLPPLNIQEQIVERIEKANNSVVSTSQHIQASKRLKAEVLKLLMVGG